MAGSFTMQVKKFREETEDKIRTTVRWICLEITSRVIMKTPVDTGRARGSWTPALDVIPGGREAIDKSGTAPLMEADSVLVQFRLGQTFYLINSVPYIMALEYGRFPQNPTGGGKTRSGKSKTVGGFSRQAPKGMVRVTLSEFPGIVDNSVVRSTR